MTKRSIWMISVSVLLICFGTSVRADFNLADAANCFTLEFYQKLASTTGGLISSPFSADVVMSMLLAGAGGATADELRTALKYGSTPISEVLDSFKSNLGQLNQGDGKNTLAIADSVWIQQGFSVKPSYQQIVQQDFYSELKNVDFEGNSAGATKEINDWVNNKTHGLIMKLFDENLDPTTIMVLVNAIYFKGVWKYQFNQTMTKKETFFNDDNSKPLVSLMHQRRSFGYKEIQNAEVLEMDYVGNEISMQVILPSQGTKISSFEKSLSCSSFGNIITSGERSLVDVTMPKFEITSRFDLKTPLQQSGINSIFSGSPDFTGISDRRIFVSKAIQKAVIKVYEEGSEAAAVTGVVSGITSIAEPPEIIYFRADRPFLFLIRHKPSNLILFMGRGDGFK